MKINDMAIIESTDELNGVRVRIVDMIKSSGKALVRLPNGNKIWVSSSRLKEVNK